MRVVTDITEDSRLGRIKQGTILVALAAGHGHRAGVYANELFTRRMAVILGHQVTIILLVPSRGTAACTRYHDVHVCSINSTYCAIG